MTEEITENGTRIIREDMKVPIAAIKDAMQSLYFKWINSKGKTKQESGYSLITLIEDFLRLKNIPIPEEIQYKIDAIKNDYALLDKGSPIYSQQLNSLLQKQDEIIGWMTTKLYQLDYIVDEFIQKEVITETEGIRDSFAHMKESQSFLQKIQEEEMKRKMQEQMRREMYDRGFSSGNWENR